MSLSSAQGFSAETLGSGERDEASSETGVPEEPTRSQGQAALLQSLRVLCGPSEQSGSHAPRGPRVTVVPRTPWGTLLARPHLLALPPSSTRTPTAPCCVAFLRIGDPLAPVPAAPAASLALHWLCPRPRLGDASARGPGVRGPARAAEHQAADASKDGPSENFTWVGGHLPSASVGSNC